MEGKLRQLMKHEGINSTRLADILGIQASGISHIMSGRNKPSFDFLLKLLQRFPQINPDWLLLDKGPMYRDEVKSKAAQSARTTTTPVAEGAMSLGASAGGERAGISSGAGNERSGGVSGTGGAGVSGNAMSAMATGGMTRPVASMGSVKDSTTSMGGMKGSVASIGRAEGLFGPDNDDIIPSGSAFGGLPVGDGLAGRDGYTGYLLGLDGDMSLTDSAIGQRVQGGYVGRDGRSEQSGGYGGRSAQSGQDGYGGQSAQSGYVGQNGQMGQVGGQSASASRQGVVHGGSTLSQNSHQEGGVSRNDLSNSELAKGRGVVYGGLPGDGAAGTYRIVGGDAVPGFDRTAGRDVVPGFDRTAGGDVASEGARRNIPADMQRFGNQSGVFVPSTDIERIVVFYRDKTFSEYRPE